MNDYQQHIIRSGLAIFRLAKCQSCNIKYVVITDNANRWFYYNEMYPTGNPVVRVAGGPKVAGGTEITSEGMVSGTCDPFCIRCGNNMEIYHDGAVKTADGRWLRLNQKPPNINGSWLIYC